MIPAPSCQVTPYPDHRPIHHDLQTLPAEAQTLQRRGKKKKKKKGRRSVPLSVGGFSHSHPKTREQTVKDSSLWRNAPAPYCTGKKFYETFWKLCRGSGGCKTPPTKAATSIHFLRWTSSFPVLLFPLLGITSQTIDTQVLV